MLQLISFYTNILRKQNTFYSGLSTDDVPCCIVYILHRCVLLHERRKSSVVVVWHKIYQWADCLSDRSQWRWYQKWWKLLRRRVSNRRSRPVFSRRPLLKEKQSACLVLHQVGDTLTYTFCQLLRCALASLCIIRIQYFFPHIFMCPIAIAYSI